MLFNLKCILDETHRADDIFTIKTLSKNTAGYIMLVLFFFFFFFCFVLLFFVVFFVVVFFVCLFFVLFCFFIFICQRIFDLDFDVNRLPSRRFI